MNVHKLRSREQLAQQRDPRSVHGTFDDYSLPAQTLRVGAMRYVAVLVLVVVFLRYDTVQFLCYSSVGILSLTR